MARIGLILTAVIAAAALGLGMALCYRPAAAKASWWGLSPRDGVRWLKSPPPFRIEPILYRHHRLFGGLLVAGAWFGFTLSLELPLPLTGGGTGHALVPWAARGITAILNLASLFGLVVGLMVFFRPSLLRPLENWGNRAYSLGQALQALRRASEPAVLSHLRPTGAVIALGALYVLVRCLRRLLV